MKLLKNINFIVQHYRNIGANGLQISEGKDLETKNLT